MLRYHMIVVTPDNALKRAVKRLTTSTGATADFVQDASEYDPARGVGLAIYDARLRPPSEAFLRSLPSDCRIIYILRGDSIPTHIPLLTEDRVSSLFCYDDQFDDDEFISSATKALRGDIFGLQKYFPWGVTTFTMLVRNYEEKLRAIEIILRYAKLAGVRGPVRNRLQLVADELMMNALYHAPVDEQGQEKYRNVARRDLARLENVSPIQVQCGCSGRYFGLSVRDGGGSLSRDRLLQYLKRTANVAEIESKSTGAGIGLVSVLRSVSKLIFNLDPKRSTEVIGLFDMELHSKGIVGARSLHVFQALSDDEAEEAAEAASSEPGRSRGTWAVAAVLAALVSALGTAYYMKKNSTTASASEGATLTIVPEPADATITVNGTDVSASTAWTIPQNAKLLEITVEQEGFATWSQTLEAPALDHNAKFYVNLTPDPPKKRNK